jgi:hypothetical protein
MCRMLYSIVFILRELETPAMDSIVTIETGRPRYESLRGRFDRFAGRVPIEKGSQER